MGNPIRTVYYSEDIFKNVSHYHDCHQILFIVEGDVEIRVNENYFRASNGSLVLFSRYENHSVRVLSETYNRFVLRINLPADEKNKIYSLLSNRPMGFNNILDVSGNIEDFRRIFSALVKEADSSLPLCEKMQELLVDELLVMIARLLPESSLLFDESNFELVSAIQHRFETHFDEQYSLSELANEYNVSTSTLSHQFKRIAGCSVMDYLLFCRMAAAKNLLVKTELTVGDIVEKCGFSNMSNFCRTFKHLFELSPTDFRRTFRHRQ